VRGGGGGGGEALVPGLHRRGLPQLQPPLMLTQAAPVPLPALQLGLQGEWPLRHVRGQGAPISPLLHRPAGKMKRFEGRMRSRGTPKYKTAIFGAAIVQTLLAEC
jgi:hypothetical protein